MAAWPFLPHHDGSREGGAARRTPLLSRPRNSSQYRPISLASELQLTTLTASGCFWLADTSSTNPSPRPAVSIDSFHHIPLPSSHSHSKTAGLLNIGGCPWVKVSQGRSSQRRQQQHPEQAAVAAASAEGRATRQQLLQHLPNKPTMADLEGGEGGLVPPAAASPAKAAAAGVGGRDDDQVLVLAPFDPPPVRSTPFRHRFER